MATKTGALALYVAAAFFVMKGWTLSNHVAIGDGGDAGSFIWFLNWWPWAALHHTNPLHTNFVWYPSGQDLTWTTSVPALSALASPVTLLAGPVWSLNLLSLLSPALSAWSAFLLFRHVSANQLGGLLAGFVFGFSPYEAGQLLGHLNLTMIAVIPAVIYVALLRLEGALSRGAFVALVAVLLVLQAGISLEVLASGLLFGALAMVVFLCVGDGPTRRGLVRLAVEIAGASIAAGVVLSPWLYVMYQGREQTPETFNQAIQYSTDLLNFIVPTTTTHLGGAAFAPLSTHFSGNASERGGYLGVPLIGLMALYFTLNIKRPAARALLLIIAIIAVCSLGPTLHIGGVDQNLALPWAHAVNLPLLGQALPCRFSAYVALAAAAAVALYLEPRSSDRRRRWKLALAATACAFIAPAEIGKATLTPAPFFEPGHVTALLGPNPNVIILPYAYFAPAMAWQVKSGMAFTESGGYLGAVPRAFYSYRWPVVGELINNRVGPGFASDLTAFCMANHVSAVLAAPGAPAVLTQALDRLQWPSFKSEDVTVYRTPWWAVTHVHARRPDDPSPGASPR